jgi:hypothetical protein
MAPEGRTVYAEIARLASDSHGVVTRAELLRAGLRPEAIKHRVRIGTLLVEYRGVYRVGHRAPSVEARYLAAVRACGDGSLLCGRAAGHLFVLIRSAPRAPEVVSPTERRVPGVETRRVRGHRAPAATIWRGVPVTTVSQTLVDLASVLAVDELARACHEAGVRYRVTPRHVSAVLARRPNTPGAGELRRVLHGDVRVTLSALETRFLERLADAGLPLPQTNRPAGGRRVDCRWATPPLTVELDSYRYHQSRHAWEHDRGREREARARGDEFRRYTYGDVFETPHSMLAELRGLLRAGPS